MSYPWLYICGMKRTEKSKPRELVILIMSFIQFSGAWKLGKVIKSKSNVVFDDIP